MTFDDARFRHRRRSVRHGEKSGAGSWASKLIVRKVRKQWCVSAKRRGKRRFTEQLGCNGSGATFGESGGRGNDVAPLRPSERDIFRTSPKAEAPWSLSHVNAQLGIPE